MILNLRHKKTSIKLEFFSTIFHLLKNGARGQTRTGTLCGRGILNPLCLPISPLGHERNNRGHLKTWQE